MIYSFLTQKHGVLNKQKIGKLLLIQIGLVRQSLFLQEKLSASKSAIRKRAFIMQDIFIFRLSGLTSYTTFQPKGLAIITISNASSTLFCSRDE